MPDASPTQVNRPGCVTAYALLLWLGGGLYLVAALCIGLFGLVPAFPDGRAAASTGPALIGALCLGLFSLLPIFLGVGLWRMRRWAWWLIVILQSLGLAGLALSLCSLFVTAGSAGRNAPESLAAGLVSAVVGGLISGGILYWFLNNRSLFDGGAQVVSGGNTWIVVAVVVVIGLVIVIPIIVIAILALLGPAIGNVFSNIIISM